MNFNEMGTLCQSDFEKADKTEEIKRKIEKAKMGALDIQGESDFIQEYATLCSFQYTEEGFAPEIEVKFKEMEMRVKEAIALVETLSEFRILLENTQGLSEEYIAYALSHENAHMNVAEQKQTIGVQGYGLIYFKKNEAIVSAQPVMVSEKKDGADNIEFLQDSISILEAPGLYGGETSDDDKDEIEKYQIILRDTTQR